MDSKNIQNQSKNQTYKNQTRFLFLSVGIHALLTFIIFNLEHWTPNRQDRIEVDFLTPEQIAKQLEPINKLNPVQEKEKQQIVDQAEKSVNDEIDPNAKFLSRNNQVIKKQTISQNKGEFRNGNGMGHTPAVNPTQKSNPISKTVISKSDIKNNSLKDDSNEKPTEAKTDSNSKRITVADLTPKMDFAKMYESHMQKEKELEKNLEQIANNKKQQESQNKESSDAKSSGLASQSLDYIKDLDPGLETLLTTREFIYYTFYNRIRNQLNQHWGPMVKERLTKLFSEGRTIASSDDKITKILVTLDNKGTLIKVQVIGDSGVRDLDEAAVDAFRKAAPFPNPPRGIIDSDGTIKIRWDFILEA